MGGRHGHDSMVVGFITSMQSVPIATDIVSSNLAQVCSFFYVYFDFLHQ